MALTQVPIELSSTPGIVDNSNATAITIDSSENVGIGVSNPSAYAANADNLVIGGEANVGMNFDSNSSSGNGGIYFSDQVTVKGILAYSHTDDAMQFFTNGTTERMRIDASGNFLVGKTSADNTTAGTTIYGAVAPGAASFVRDAGNTLVLNRLTSDGEILAFRKDGAPVGSIGTVDGFAYISSNSNVGLKFLSQRIRPVNSDGSDRDDAIDLGASSARFDDIYATNGTIQTSDRNEKQDIEALSDAEQRVAVAAKGLLRKFRWISSVEENGDDARIHFGIIAQDLQDAFTAEGLDAGRYAMFISSTWTDEETGEERTRLGVRYSELLAFIISAI